MINNNQSPHHFPVQLTTNAIVQLKKLLARKGGEGSFIRIGVKGGGCSGLEYVLRLEEKSNDKDLVIETEGLKVVCDAKSAKFLDGCTLEYTGNLMHGGYEFNNPNAARSCGCGTSFIPKDHHS